MSATLSPPDLDPSKINTYFNGVVQDAIDYMAENKGGRIWLPPQVYDPVKNPKLNLHGHVTLAGLVGGPFDHYTNPADPTAPIGATFLVENTDASFLTFQVGQQGLTAKDLVFFHPDQVANTSSQPKSYPPTVLVSQGASGARLSGLYGINPFVFIDCEVGRVDIDHIHSGAIQCGLIVDHAEDYVKVDNFVQTTSYNNFPNCTAPSALDEYTMANRYAMMILRCDSFHASQLGLWWNYCGFYFGDSADMTLPFSRAGYGQIVNADIDTAQYPVIASSTDVVGGGFTMMNCNMGGQSQAKSVLIAIPGAQEPVVTWIGGALRGTWPGGVINNNGIKNAKLTIRDVVGYDILP